MIILKLKTPRVAKAMLDARKDMSIPRQVACDILGISSVQRLYHVEKGFSPFPMGSIARACELYELDLLEVWKLLIDDYTECLMEEYDRAKTDKK